ncbi:MAG TPA: universal stress protein [Polyangiaceae bacterium]|nr:universal stress protein [Polyangiaceae bacterium]
MRKFGSILVALDLSDCSQELIETAVKFADASTHVVLLYVADASVGARASGSTSVSQWLQRSHERLVAYRQTMPGVHVSMDLVEGPIATTILEQAAKHQAELIIMGTHGRRGAARLVGGSVAAEVVSLAECPVLTVRTKHTPSCRAQGCDQCDTHLTPELWQVMAEREG